MTTTTVGEVAVPGRPAGNHPAGMVRTCDTTGLPVCLTAEKFIKLHAVVAVVFLLIGGIGAILLGLTRWPAVHLLSAPWYYRILTLHGLDMLIVMILIVLSVSGGEVGRWTTGTIGWQRRGRVALCPTCHSKVHRG